MRSMVKLREMGALLDLLVLINSQSLSVPKGDTRKKKKKKTNGIQEPTDA